MNNKICIGILYTTYLLHFVGCDESNEKLESSSQEIDKNNNRVSDDEINASNLDYEEDEKIESYEDLELERNKEKEVGDYADLFGTNQHYNIPVNYQDLGRRFVLSYPYFEKKSANDEAETELDNAVKQHLAAKKISDKKLIPMKAPPEFVLAIAKESALLEATKPKNPTDNIIKKDILRTGDYWNNVWKEDVDANQFLRSSNNNQNKLESITVEISPGSKLYDLVSILQRKSPRLLYVINKNNDE